MIRRSYLSLILGISFVSIVLAGCAGMQYTSPESNTTSELIESLRDNRIETLYYVAYPAVVKELILRQGIVADLISAYDLGGDELFRFNLIVILNHRKVFNQSVREDILRCLVRALKDSSPWTRTEAVWGLGLSGNDRVIPGIIPLLDDPDPGVVNETILALAKLTGIADLPVSNSQMREAERIIMVNFWKSWWNEVKINFDQAPGTI